MDEDSFQHGKFEENLQEQRDEVFALQSIFNTDDEEKLKLLSEVTESKENLYTLLVLICPKPAQESIQVCVVVPAEEEDDDEELEGAAAAPPTNVASSPPALSRNVPLSRSLSGQRWQGSFEIKFLTPLNLLVTFPPTYPSTAAPSVHLACDWLAPLQLESLESILQTLWSEACNMPIVFTWVDWLENNCLSHLAITDQLILKQSVMSNDKLELAGGMGWEEDLGATIASMIRYNQEKLNEEFCQTMHLCEICYDEYPGTQFFKINECSHAFCHTCMQAFCKLHATEGTVEELRCPTPKCDSVVPPYIVETVLPREAFERWEQLMLQKTLDSMEDTVYCPRCSSVVIVEEERELNLAHCPVCFFAFCTQCERVWHQGRDCETDEEILQNLEQKNTDGMQGAVYRKFLKLRKKLEWEIKSKAVVKKNTRPCPSCRIPVEKIGGCNKMTCRCGQIFCWMCGKKIQGYTHFQSGACILFPGQAPIVNHGPQRLPNDAVIRMQALIELNPELRNNRCYCPMCKQENLKGQDRNNHIKCWNCKTNFCFMCKQRIVGVISTHFVGACNQHS